MVYQIVDCRGRVCLPEPMVTTLEVMHKTSCSRASESGYYRQNDSIVNVQTQSYLHKARGPDRISVGGSILVGRKHSGQFLLQGRLPDGILFLFEQSVRYFSFCSSDKSKAFIYLPFYRANGFLSVVQGFLFAGLLRPTTAGYTSHCSRTYVPLQQDVRSTVAGRSNRR